MTRSSRKTAQPNYAALAVADPCSDEDDFCNVSRRKSSRTTSKENNSRGSPIAKRPRLSPEDKFECDIKVALGRSQENSHSHQQQQQQQQLQQDCRDPSTVEEIGQVCQIQEQRDSAATVKEGHVLPGDGGSSDDRDEGDSSADSDSYQGCHSDSDASISSDGVDDDDDGSEDDYLEEPLAAKAKPKNSETTGKGKAASVTKPAALRKTQSVKKEPPKKIAADKKTPPVASPPPKPSTTAAVNSTRAKPTSKPAATPGVGPGAKLSHQAAAGLGGVKLPARGSGLGGVRLSSPRGQSAAGVKLESPGGRNVASKFASPGGLGGVKLTSPSLGGGIRLGLSRNARVKPLHQVPAAKH